MTDVCLDRARTLRHSCRIDQQFKLIAQKEAAGLPHGQNVEALRIALLKLRRLLPADAEAELEQMIQDGNEAGKPG